MQIWEYYILITFSYKMQCYDLENWSRSLVLELNLGLVGIGANLVILP